MPTDAAQLATIKSQILAILVDLTENPKPSYNIDGQEIKWAEYFDTLTQRLEKIDAVIASNSPWEIQSQGYT